MLQKNEGKWSFSLSESFDGTSIELEVLLGRYLESSWIECDIQPTYVRLLIKVCSIIML
jgi:protein TilB